MISTKRQPIESAASVPTISGKYVILAVVTVALTGALASWFFRYNATQHAAEFWGPEAARLIRDAPVVEFWQNPSPSTVIRSAAPLVGREDLRDISSARGLVHLRTALIEDRSFDWPAKQIRSDVQWTHGLRFRADTQGVLLMFSPDLKWIRTGNAATMLSCEPIAHGLREMFDEFSAKPADDAAEKSR
jgi:hypothetical protein